MSNFENDNDFLAGLKAEFEPAGNKSGNDFLAGLKDEFEPKKPQGGIWETTKAFGRDLAKVPSEISSGFGTTTDQMRMFANFVQGDREELENLYNSLKNYTPLPESETTVGGWVRGAANTLPYMGMSATAGVGGGSIGGALGSVVPYVGTAVGRRAGAALGSASVGFAQGWGEMYGRLRDEGIDHDTAAGIAFAVAPVYAGIEAVQVRKIPGAAQLADKYLGSTFKKILAEKFADKALRNKVAKALGSYAGEIISQSAEEGAQEMAMNTGEQYARNDGFKNFDIGENLSAGAEAFKESVGPFAVMQAGNIPINAILNRRAKRLQKDLENVQNAVEEGKGAMKGGVSVPPNTPLGGIFVADKKFYRNVDGVAVPLKKEEIVKIRANESETDNLDADAESDPYGKPDTKPEDSNTDLDAVKDESAKLQVPNVPQESAPVQNAGERAAQIFMANVQNDPLNVPQGIPPNVDMSLARFVQMQRQLREAQARKAEEEAKRLEADRKAEEAMFDAQAEADFEAAKRKTAEKLSKLANKTNRVAARIDKIKDPAARLNAIKSAVDEGNIEKLSDKHLEFAWENGEQWAERELFRRQEAANSGTPLLEVMKENGFKLPTPAAIKRHAQEHGRGLSGYLFGEINDLYNSLPTNQRLKYFTKNYVNLDETAESLKQFGFNYDSEGEFISDVASNLSGQKYSYGFSLAENDYAKMSDAELVEAHRKAEAAKDYSAGFEIKKEWDRRRGYNTDVYHGTGADGFNVAKADASEAKNGEGAQAHGMGLYASGNKEVANAYKEKAVYDKPYYSYWAKGEELSKGAKELGIRDVYFNDAMSKITDVGFARIKKDLEKEIKRYTKDIEELDRRIAKWKEKARRSRTKYYDYMGYVESYSYDARKKAEYKQEAEAKLKLYQLVNDWLASKGISEKELEKRERSDGKLYNWRTNLAKEDTLDEQLPFSKQSREVQEKIKNAIESLTEEQLGGVSKEDALRDFVENNTDGGNIYDAFENYTGSKKNASKHLLKHGIRGITYDGKRDGRCYVSFEGGSAVKLQDAFTYGDDGKYIPLDKRSDAGNPDMRYSIGETDAQRFKNELQDYKNGKRNFTMVLGTTPEVLKRCGVPDSNIELTDKTLTRKLAQHPELDIDALKELPAEIADPIAVFQSQQIPNSVVVLTEIQTDRGNVVAAIHFDIRNKKGFLVNDIRSIHGRPDGQIVNFVRNGMTRYVNTKRAPYWLRSPLVQFHGRDLNNNVLYGDKIQTESDLSQAEKENIFKLRGKDKRHSYSISEGGKANQTKIDGIKAAVEDVRAKFNRRAKVKSDVSVVGTLEDARGVLGAESIPYNARAVQDKEKVVIIAENIADADEAVRIFLHEQVGHWGLRKLLKADLKPFLNYIIAHYQDSDAWKRVAKYYKDVAKNKYAIAEEVLAHVAENRELSDPSMWKRLVHRVKRELWGNGVPQAYVNLLNEDVLRSAIALSREWAKGDHYLNANGIWAKIESAPKGRDVPDEPDDGKRFSLIGEKGVSRLKNGLARDLLNEAVEMEKSGVDADKIWQETGWERNTVDGKWRFEIPYGFLKRDPRFKSPTRGVNAFEFPTEQTYSPTRKYKLADIWNAPILFEAYPELADMRVKFNANPRSLTRGSASKEDGLTINLKDTDLLFGNPIWVKESDIKRTIQHEIEHALQEIEGFSEGATPYTMRRISAFYNNPEGYRKAKEEIAAAKKPFTDFCLSLGWDGEGRMPKAFKEKLANDRTLANKYMTLVNAYNTTYRNASKYYTMPSEKFGYEQYRRVGGEVEARNAARRLEMTDDERKAKRPSLTADVEPSSQIYLGDSNIDSLNFHDFKTGEKYNAAETRFSIREDSDAEKIDTQHRELYERYKNGDQAAYEEAAKLVADYAKSKGYDVKVYHGTGADGFNVADATTRNQKFGEGNQAHGKGLYIAMTPETAERYRRAGRKTESIVVGGKNPEEFDITPENIGINAGRIGDLLRRMYPHGSEFLLSDIKERIARQKDVLTRYKARLENLRPPDTKGSLEMGIRMSESLIVSYEKEYAAAKKIDSILKKHNVSVEMRRGRGKVFEWFTNLKPSEVIDEGKTLSEQPDVLKKLEEIWDKVLYPVVDEELKNGSSDAAYVQRYKPTGYLLGEAVIDGWSNYLGKTSFNDLMLEHGIRGITYDGHIDGRCYVSFEGGSTVKLQDPFTFDDNGQLIPLSERFDEGNPDMRYSIKEEDEAGARAIRKELPNFIQSMMEIKEGLDENWASFVGKEFSADLIKKIVSFNIDKNQPTNLYEYNEKEGNSSRSSQPSPTGEGIESDRRDGRDIRGSVGSWQQGMGQEASDTLLEEFRRLSRAQERMGEKQKIATRADAIKWIRKNVAQGAFFKNHPNLHIEDLFEYKAGSKFSGSKTVEALLEDSEQYSALSVFDQIRIAAVLQRRELKNEYKPVFGGKESLENDKTGGVFVPKNEKVAESQILAADTIRGCDNDCYDCYANKLSKISTINFTHKVPMTLDNIKIKEGQVIRIGTSGDPASNWTHSRNEMIKLFERAWKGSARVKPQDVSFEKNSFVITKLQSIQGYDPKVFPNLEVSLDPFYPEDMFLAMKNLTVLMAMCPDVNVVARIRSFNSNRPYLKQSLDSALQFCKDHNLRVLETRMRFESKTAYSLLGLVEDDYKNKMSASGEKELAQVVGKVRFLPNFYTEEEKSRLLFCGENGELGCGACQNCVNTQVYNREQSGRNSPIIAQSLDGQNDNGAYAGISDSDMPMYSLKEETPETDKEYKQKRAREEIQSKAGRAVQAAVDAFAPLAALERVLYGGVRGAEKSAWKMALMTRNLDQVMFHVLRVGGIKYNKADGSFVKREGTKGLEEILKPVKGENYKNFEHYAKAKSAIERWAFLRKTNFFAGKNFYDTFGFSLEDAKKWVAEGSGASKKAFDELQIFFQGQRDFMLETGLITPEQHAALSRFKNYVPFFREGADLDAETEAAYERFSEIFPAGKGFSGRNSGVEKFEGSARRTKNLVENIVNQSRKVMDSGYKNIAAYRSLNLMRELDMAKYVRSDSVDAQVKIAEMRRALEAEGIEVGDISDEELLKKVPVEAYLKITDDSNDNIVSVRVNGTLRFYKVEDPELLVAVKNFGAEKVNVMWKLLTAPKNIMTQAITKTPEFAIRNFIRDTGSNTILFGGKTLAPYLAHTAKNAVKSAWNTEDMQKVWAAGAGGGAWYSVKAEDIAADFKDGGKIQKIGKYTIKPLKWLLNEYERRILMPSEQGNRISVMQKALENGASDMEAAFQYLDVMNFGMRGSGVWTGKNEWAKGAFTALHAVVRITPFLNARIQGLYKLWRESGAQDARFKAGEEFALKERTRAFVQSLSKAVLLRGMMMASASMLYSLYANSSTDDDGDKWFEKLPAHDKLNYWHFYLGNNNILRIPKPFEIGYIFGTIPEAITDALIQTRPQTAKVLWAGLTSQLEFDPLSNPVIDTVREQYWNKDSFTKRPIVQQSDKDLKPRYQYDPDTSATAKAVARVFEGVGLDDSWLASPARIQNVIGNFLGGMTKYITAASDVIVESLTDIEGGTSRYARENATKRVYDWAVRNTKTMTTRNAEDYYALRNRVREVYGAARVLRQEKRLEECQNLIDEHKGELGNYDLIEAVNTRLGEISRKRKALGANRTLSTEELIRADDELLVERNKLLADVDILIDRVESGNFNARDMRDILKRIRNADREKKDSKKARSRLHELANMR